MLTTLQSALICLSPGEGFTINIPWNKDKMGDSEYKCAFDSIILPVANQFKPDLIFVAAGFDAATADPLGEYVLTSDMYAYMTQKLASVASVIIALEGGYSARSIGEALICCTKVLKANTDYKVTLDIREPCRRAQQTIKSVIQCQSKYWDLAT